MQTHGHGSILLTW